jgi:hypothetical protein
VCVEFVCCYNLFKTCSSGYVGWCLGEISHVLYPTAGSRPPSPGWGWGASRLRWTEEPPCCLSRRRLRCPFPGLGRRCCGVLLTGGALPPVVCECRQGVVFEIPVLLSGNSSSLVPSSLSTCANCLSSPPCLVIVGLFAASTSLSMVCICALSPFAQQTKTFCLGGSKLSQRAARRRKRLFLSVL